MATADSNFRPNPTRRLLIAGEIRQELLDRITPEILTLRATGNDPITVYIDSYGGSTRISAVISNLLRTPNQSAQLPRVITVVTGSAASAAADLLASGDYAIAYPESWIYYHGTRRIIEGDLTLESAKEVADALQEANDVFAVRLADRAIERFMFLFLSLRAGFPTIRKKLSLEKDTEVKVFAAALRQRVSPSLRSLVDDAILSFEETLSIDTYIWDRLEPEGKPFGENETEILKLILDFELARNKTKSWTLSAGGLVKAVEDFLVFNDFNFGRQRHFLTKFASGKWGKFFMGEEERNQLLLELKAETNPEKAVQDLVEGRMQPIWYFVYCVCKLLQKRETSLSASDAYWLGIVDEVLGLGLPCLRELVENQPQQESAVSP